MEEFITDASNNLVDRNRLFGQPGETAAQGLKKKVSNTVVKCLTDQINEQFDQINGLEKERELYLKKIRSMESQLQASLGPGGNNPAASAPAAVAAEAASVDILTGSTASAIEKLFNSPSASLGARVSGHNESILNSFVSQYIPPSREMTKDLTELWESELFNTFKLTPVVDNQGQRLYVRYSSDTISILLGPFTYLVAELSPVELVTDVYATLGIVEIIDELYRSSRLAIYIEDLGRKYCPASATGGDHGIRQAPSARGDAEPDHAKSKPARDPPPGAGS